MIIHSPVPKGGGRGGAGIRRGAIFGGIVLHGSQTSLG